MLTLGHADNSAALAAWRAEDAAARSRRVENALVQMRKAPGGWSVADFCVAAGVSRSWLYASRYWSRVAVARDEAKRGELTRPKAPQVRASDEGLRARLKTALDENARLRGQVVELREDLAVALGELRELRVGHKR